MPKFNFIKEEVDLGFKPSSAMLEIIAEAEEADLAGSKGLYSILSEHLEIMGKSTYAEGCISKRQWDAICEKYPYPY